MPYNTDAPRQVKWVDIFLEIVACAADYQDQISGKIEGFRINVIVKT